LWNYATEGRQKRFIKSAFQQYLSGDVIEQMLADPKRLQLGGEKRELTMFFSDLKGFSTISESLEPAELTSLMNDVLSDVCEVIFEEGGTVDKFIGDAVVAFWNAPVPQADHAARAVRAAIRCQRRLAEKSDAYRARAKGIPIHMRIGLNTGDVVVGNMGSRQRFNYTMLGDAANLASRLEGANKAFGTTIMVGETTWKQLGGSVPGREIAAVRVVGRATPVRVFEPLGLPGETVPAKFEHYAKALDLVRQKQWGLAADHFQDIPNDPLAAKYAERCMALRDGQLADWDGVWNLTEK
jgi:adenylate cyclase